MDIEDVVCTKTEIISASRRTDIPAFYMNHVINAMKNGYIQVTNQYGSTSTISLDPKDVKCIVWWSKNYSHWLKKYHENIKLFSKYKHMFNFTITGSNDLENGVKSSLTNRLQQVKELSELFGANSIKYRFDPIVVYIQMDTGEQKNNLEHFEEIIKYVSNCGVKEVIIAFCLPYKKVVARMKQRGKFLVDVQGKERNKILDDMIEITDKFGMKISSCCNTGLCGYKQKIFPSKCVDGNEIEKIIGTSLKQNKKDKGQRKECNCVVSRDIGEYTMKCYHNCDYCYSNPSDEKIIKK